MSHPSWFDEFIQFKKLSDDDQKRLFARYDEVAKAHPDVFIKMTKWLDEEASKKSAVDYFTSAQDAFILESLEYHASAGRMRLGQTLADCIARRKARRVASLGCGIATDELAWTADADARLALTRVACVDLPGPSLDFARWRAPRLVADDARRAAVLRFVETTGPEPVLCAADDDVRCYDFIVCIEALQYFPAPAQVVRSLIERYLLEGAHTNETGLAYFAFTARLNCDRPMWSADAAAYNHAGELADAVAALMPAQVEVEERLHCWGPENELEGKYLYILKVKK